MKKSFFLGSVLLVVVVVLHIMYVETTTFKTPFTQVVPEPLAVSALELTTIVRPTYLHPSNPIQYHYAESGGSETVVIEEVTIGKPVMVFGDANDYYDESVDGFYVRGFATGAYPVASFFYLQYVLVGLAILSLLFGILQKKK